MRKQQHPWRNTDPSEWSISDQVVSPELLFKRKQENELTLRPWAPKQQHPWRNTDPFDWSISDQVVSPELLFEWKWDNELTLRSFFTERGICDPKLVRTVYRTVTCDNRVVFRLN